MPYDMITIMIPATIEVNFAVVSGKFYALVSASANLQACLPTIRPLVQNLFPNSGLASGGQSSNRGYGQSSTNGVRTGTGVKLRTLTTAFELDDDSSTKNFADRNYAPDAFVDVETGSSGSNEDNSSRPGPRTVIEAGPDGRRMSGRDWPTDGRGIRIQNEMSISYETRGDRVKSPTEE